jgi:hypothetical protein
MSRHSRFLSKLAVLSLFAAFPAFADEAAAGDGRPEGTAVGIGIGYTFPRSILEPNTASVRFKLGGITLEPRLNLGGSSLGGTTGQYTQIGDQPPNESSVENKNGGLGLSVGTDVRFALGSRGPLDLLFIGGISVGWANNSGDATTSTSDIVSKTSGNSTSAVLNWGLGLEWFLGKGFSLSADAVNPLVSWTRSTTTTETSRPGTDTIPALVDRDTTNNTSVSYGLTFQPTIRAMVHLYF